MNREEFEDRMYNLHKREMSRIAGDLLNMSESAFDEVLEQMHPKAALAVLTWLHNTEHKRTIILSRLAALAHDDPT